jgi:hemin uptake protein HemP
VTRDGVAGSPRPGRIAGFVDANELRFQVSTGNDRVRGEANSTGPIEDMNGCTAVPGQRPAAANTSEGKTPPRIRRLEVESLLGGGRECIIVHGESEYRLRITSSGKLILTK